MGFHQQRSDEKSKQCGGRWRFEIPDYLTDLNAMHEAEKVLDYWQACVMDDNLQKVRPFTNNAGSHSHNWHCTAAQRAEAFLRTLNLWDDTK